MGRRILWPLVLCMGVARGADDPLAAHDKAHGRPELARVGTIGDRPPPESTLVVHIRADGAILVHGMETTLAVLGPEVGRRLKANPALSILLRADARLPWGAVESVLVACATGGARRVFHAVLPETGDEEGAFLWPLPRDWAGPEPISPWLAWISDAEPPGVTPAHLYWAVREARPTEVVLEPHRDLPADVILRCADSLCRAGVGSARIARLSVAAERLTEPRDVIRIFSGKPPRAGIDLRFEDTLSGQAKPMPPLERVRGGFAGWTADEPAHAAGEAKVWSRRVPGSDGRHGGGATAATEDAVALGLAWLARHQDADGKWDCDGFAAHDPAGDKCDGAGAAPYDVGVTALALLAFLGAGSTGSDPGPYAGHVRKGLDYLVASQDDYDGVFGPQQPDRAFYSHVLATHAMCEACGMTGDRRYKTSAQMGLNRIAMARNPGLAWRYRPRGGDNDTSVTAWCALALRAGSLAKLEVDPDALRGAEAWVDSMTAKLGKVGYNVCGGPEERPPGRGRWRYTESMTAAGTVVRMLAGDDPASRPIRRGAFLCSERPPRWDREGGDMCYWYWGTLVSFHVGGRPWDIWNRALHEQIVPRQNPKGSGARAGSWDPLDPWGPDGGRVYSTALMTMCLEVYYRYERR